MLHEGFRNRGTLFGGPLKGILSNLGFEKGYPYLGKCPQDSLAERTANSAKVVPSHPDQAATTLAAWREQPV